MLLRFWAFCALFAGGATCLPAAVLYTVTDLGRGTSAKGINNAGQITGYSYIQPGSFDGHAFLYSNGVMTDLGTLPGTTFSSGNGINDAGQIAGYSYSYTAIDPVTSVAVGHAFLYSNGVMTDLGTLGGTNSEGFAISNAGQVTGGADTASGYSHAFLYSNGVLTDLGTLPGRTASVGYAINNAGQITGNAYGNAFDYGDAFLYSNGVLTDLGALPLGYYSYGLAINNTGQIAGFSVGAAFSRAFLYSNGVLTDLNSLIDPNLHITTLYEATGINDLGQIVANSYDYSANGEHAYLLTPVPEPGTWLLFGAGLLLLGVLARAYGR